MFIVDANTGVVRTRSNQYKRGEYYKIFVQARDRRIRASKLHKVYLISMRIIDLD